MSEIVQWVNGRLIIDGNDVTYCPKIAYKDSLNPICEDFGKNSMVTCYGNPNCMFKRCSKTEKMCDDIISTLEKTVEELKRLK